MKFSFSSFQQCKVGINFVDRDEAQAFFHQFQTKQEDRQSQCDRSIRIDQFIFDSRLFFKERKKAMHHTKVRRQLELLKHRTIRRFIRQER